MVTEHLKGVYTELKEVVSPELNYHRYKLEIITSMNQAPCVPRLGKNSRDPNMWSWNEDSNTRTAIQPPLLFNTVLQ